MSLIDVFMSARQQRLLAPLLLNPDHSFGTLELVRLSGAGTGAGHSQIKKLIEAGVVRVSELGNQKRIQINQACPIYPELRALCLKTFGLADRLRDAVLPLAERIHVAFIFGSIAKGSDTADSDIDVMVVSDDLAYADLFNVLSSAEETLGRKISPTLYGTAEFERKVTDDNHFVTRVLTQPKIFLKGTADDLPARQPA
jgi:predicted nucleotidyltransferase